MSQVHHGIKDLLYTISSTTCRARIGTEFEIEALHCFQISKGFCVGGV